MPWETVLLDDLTGAAVGELSNPYDRSISWRHNRVTTSHFAVDLRDPLADRLLEADLLVKLYEDDILRGVHEVTDVEEVVTEDKKRLGVTCSDAFWRLGARLIGKSTTGHTVTNQDIATAISGLLAGVNAEDDTGVRMGSVDNLADVYAGPWHYKPLAEVISELAATLDGPDWRINPVEPTADATGVKWGELELRNAIGTTQPHAVFAYSDDEDDRGNVKSYTRTVSKQGMLNTGYSLPPGFPDTDPTAAAVQSWYDGPARARWHWREGVVPGDLGADNLRLKLLQEHVAVRKNPREVITFNGLLPSDLVNAAEAGIHVPACPAFKVDYDVGDIVPFRATVDGVSRVNGLFRIYGVDLAISDEGLETPTVSVIPGEG